MIRLLKRLSRCVREYKASAILTPIFVSLEVIIEVIMPLLLADLIDYGIQGEASGGLIMNVLRKLFGVSEIGNMQYTLITGALLVVLCGFSLLFGALSGNCCAVASSGFAGNVRHDMYHKIQEYSFSNIDKFSSASIVTRITTDVRRVQEAFQVIIRIAVRCPLMFIMVLVSAFRINSKLSLIFLAASPILFVGLMVIIKFVHPIFEKVLKTYDTLNRVVEENLRGVRIVKSFVREDFEIEKFENVSNEIYKDFSRAEKLLAFNSPLMQFCMYGCTLLVSWFGAKMIVDTNGTALSTGEFSTLISYSIQMLMSLMMVSMVFVIITTSRASAERVVEILDEESDISNCAEPIMSVDSGDVKFEHVSFTYSSRAEKKVLDDISFEIKSGMSVGILGGTGSSKSSLVQLIPRLYDMTGGCVSVAGIDVKKYDIEALRNSVAMVLQKNVLFSGTVKENLRWGNPNATDAQMIEACKLAQADDFINNFPDKYDTYIEQGGTNVSGGQKQRLCIARALLKNPKIIIMDDSTSAVDTATDALIQKAFTDSIPGITKIVIAQRVSSIASSDMIIVLDDGKINGIGSHDELLKTNDIYREIYEEQTKKGGDDNE